jgi:hypothetical protein
LENCSQNTLKNSMEIPEHTLALLALCKDCHGSSLTREWKLATL